MKEQIICGKCESDVENTGVPFFYSNFYADEDYCYDCYDNCLSPAEQENCIEVAI